MLIHIWICGLYMYLKYFSCSHNWNSKHRIATFEYGIFPLNSMLNQFCREHMHFTTAFWNFPDYFNNIYPLVPNWWKYASIKMGTKYNGIAGTGTDTARTHVRAVAVLAKLCTVCRPQILLLLVLGHRIQRWISTTNTNTKIEHK